MASGQTASICCVGAATASSVFLVWGRFKVWRGSCQQQPAASQGQTEINFTHFSLKSAGKGSEHTGGIYSPFFFFSLWKCRLWLRWQIKDGTTLDMFESLAPCWDDCSIFSLKKLLETSFKRVRIYIYIYVHLTWLKTLFEIPICNPLNSDIVKG